MFFKPKFYETDPNAPVRFTAETVLELPECGTAGFLKDLYAETFGKVSGGTGTLCTKLILTRGLPENPEVVQKCGADGSDCISICIVCIYSAFF